MKASYKILLLFAVTLLQVSCEAEDPFVDREVSPLLVLLAGDDGVASSGLTTEPTVTSAISKAATFSVKLYELDKSGILDKNIGIDSVAASGVSLEIKRRTGGTITTATTNASGVATFTVTWADLGISAPSSSSSVSLNCSGSYKDKSFTKLFRIGGK
ncbi:MAG: hypothetical protein NWQ46_01335 [Spirosomaceae bacterium]|nr:hypothetical protein [Spirosomataceae bacterium]MDP5140374.1 hypothetical protein [Spirosomataceae bacterium]